MSTHRYETQVRWTGSTGLGWDAYTREHTARAPGVEQAVGIMPLDEEPVRITEIELRPTITVTGEVSEERIHKLVDTAHRHCFVANSLTAQMTITPTVEVST
jgi:organic hydroperoxide reductase OsmC/OhrA